MIDNPILKLGGSYAVSRSRSGFVGRRMYGEAAVGVGERDGTVGMRERSEAIAL